MSGWQEINMASIASNIRTTTKGISKALYTTTQEVEQIEQFIETSSHMKPCDTWHLTISKHIKKLLPIYKKQEEQHRKSLGMLKLTITDIEASKNDFTFIISLIRKDKTTIAFFEACMSIDHKLIRETGMRLISATKNHWELINPENQIKCNNIVGITSTRLTYCRRKECITCSVDCDPDSIIICKSCNMASYCSIEHLKKDSKKHNQDECDRFLSVYKSEGGLILSK
jgi:hypothetical protein